MAGNPTQARAGPAWRALNTNGGMMINSVPESTACGSSTAAKLSSPEIQSIAYHPLKTATPS